MKIAIVSSNEQTTPPPDNVIIASMYVSTILAQGLVKNGHDITTIVGEGSPIKTKKHFSKSKPFFEVVNKSDWEKTNDLRLMWQLMVPFEIDLNLSVLDFLKMNPVDLVHFHSIVPFYGLPFAGRTGVPCIFTLHGTTSPLELQVIKTFLANNIHFVSISNNQQLGYPGITFASTVYNGIPLEDYGFGDLGGEHMVMAGRFKKDKGFEEGIEVALRTRKRLVLAGDIRPSQKAYFYSNIEPLIKSNSNIIHFLHFVNHSMMDGFYREGKLLLFPIQWEEPFGLAMIEAMATGTPVVAFARGSVPEVIKDGETGFIVNSSDDDIRGNWIIKKTGIAGMCEAVEKIYALPQEQYRHMRKACRTQIEKHFTVERMVNDYENVYQKILNALQ